MQRSVAKGIAIAVAAVAVVVGIVAWGSRGSVSYVAPTEAPRPTLGPDTALFVLEEFSDFQCPACKAAQPMVKDVLETFGDRLQFSYRHLPLVSIHPQAFRAALAAECANDQGKFWEYHDRLFEEQPRFSRDELVGYASDLGLAVDGSGGFAACLDSRAKTEAVRADMREADVRRVNSTPTFFLNGEAVRDWSQLKSLIQAKATGG